MKQATVNTFGALGYSSLIIQWFWTVLTIGLSFFTSDIMKQLFLPPEQPAEVRPPVTFEIPNSIELIITIFSVIFALGIIIYALVAVPRAIGRGGQKITQASAKTALPHFSQHRRMSKKQQRKLFEHITWSVKIFLVFLPLILLLVPPAPTLGLSHYVVVATGFIFGITSLLLFLLQYILAHYWRVPAKQVW